MFVCVCGWVCVLKEELSLNTHGTEEQHIRTKITFQRLFNKDNAVHLETKRGKAFVRCEALYRPWSIVNGPHLLLFWPIRYPVR